MADGWTVGFKEKNDFFGGGVGVGVGAALRDNDNSATSAIERKIVRIINLVGLTPLITNMRLPDQRR